MSRTRVSTLLKKRSIGVLYGGPSSERAVSIESGLNCAEALEGAGYSIQRVLLDGSFTAASARALGIDIALLALHGEFGEDGQIQTILEDAGIPYTGSGADASATAFNKVLAKRAFEAHGVPTPQWKSMEISEVRAADPATLGLQPPLVIKPACGGSSLGITIVRSADQILPALHKASEYGNTILIERHIAGRELTVGVLGDTALPIAELKLSGEFYDYNAKYHDDRTLIVCPAELDAVTASRVQAIGLAAHRALGCRDVSRTDVMLSASGEPWVLEVNTLPGMTSHSLLPRGAAATGRSFAQLCEELLCLALARSLPSKKHRAA